MSPADLDLARQRLHDRRRALLARYHRTLDLVDEELDSREIEDVDTSSEQWDAQVLTALSVADRRHAEAIGAALERVAAGSYGRCVRCGAVIDDARLAALPEAPTCIGCALETDEAPLPRA
ncbi:MAG: TraR/DksA family transcriptional regulator, partial [Myxococcales bacterium]|nr:TraR/DksA family transcriptional regulator [Myxococcales bacterium]